MFTIHSPVLEKLKLSLNYYGYTQKDFLLQNFCWIGTILLQAEQTEFVYFPTL